MSHYSSCHPSSLPRPHPSPSPIFFSFCLLFYLPPLHLSHALFSLIFLFSVLALCLKQTHLSLCLHPPKQHPTLPLSPCLIFCSNHPSIHHPRTHSLALSLPLISLPMLWFVSPVSVRTVITAVSSLGENKVVLCSRHHKRHERNKRKESLSQKKKKKRLKGGKIKKEGSKLEEKEGARNTSFHVNHDALSSVGYNNH